MSDAVDELEKADIIQPGEEHFDLENWPFYWITRAYGQYMSSLEQTLKSVELDIPRWRVLMLLQGARARSISYLSTEAITKLSTMTRIVQRMQDDGLVITRPRASDQRVTEVLLTGNGRRARLLALHQAETIYANSFNGLSASDLKQLNKLLSRIHANLS